MPSVNTQLSNRLGTDVPIVSAPMAFAATGKLASAVSKEGGFGMIGAGFLSSQDIRENFKVARDTLNVEPGAAVPIGIGCIGWILDMTEASDDPRLVTILEEKPVAIWLAFGLDLGKYVSQIRAYDAQRDHKTIIFVMVNSVEDALKAQNEWKVDVIVVQGIEAGGHGGSEAPPLLTLLQAVLDALPEDRPLVVATGGISTGQQIAALLTLGADGVALGTRFLFTEECIYTDAMKEAIIQAGHNDTVRTLAYDDVGRTNYWPPKHDGRALRNKVMDDLNAGLSLEERLKRFDESAAAGDKSRLVVWAGAGVGLTKKISPAADVVRELRTDVLTALSKHSAL
ncbi:2-nitropropane dioxygenase [Coprinopsis sp. MPI-PUGE-AT-0042]|nr:2-nitropropane dioxygenase [Coprinopsis sp. MPI-PUGE-AT-0042]